jgi:hypothetical protein
MVNFYYSLHDLDGKVQLGIFFYDQEIYVFSEDIPNQIRSYKIIMSIEYGEKNKDVFSIVVTCNILDYIKDITYEKDSVFFEEEYTTQEFDTDKFIIDFLSGDDYYSKEFKFIKDRLIRRYNNIITNSTVLEDNVEFLELDESACILGGPHGFENKEGCYISIHENKKSIESVRKSMMGDIDFIRSSHSFLLPHNRSIDGEYSTFSNNYYNMSKEEKKKFIESLSHERFFKLYKNVVKYLSDEESIESKKPYRIYMYGNDDSSWTKWFFTKEEVEKELEYLRMMQPLNLYKDFTDRGYLFTN